MSNSSSSSNNNNNNNNNDTNSNTGYGVGLGSNGSSSSNNSNVPGFGVGAQQPPPPPSPFNPAAYQIPNAPRTGPAPTPQQAPPTPRSLDDATTSDDGAPPATFSFGRRSAPSCLTTPLGSLSQSSSGSLHSIMSQPQLQPQVHQPIGISFSKQSQPPQQPPPPPSPYTPGMYNMPPAPVPGPAPTPIGAAPTPRNLDDSGLMTSDDGVQGISIWSVRKNVGQQQQQQQQQQQHQQQLQLQQAMQQTGMMVNEFGSVVNNSNSGSSNCANGGSALMPVTTSVHSQSSENVAQKAQQKENNDKSGAVKRNSHRHDKKHQNKHKHRREAEEQKKKVGDNDRKQEKENDDKDGSHNSAKKQSYKKRKGKKKSQKHKKSGKKASEEEEDNSSSSSSNDIDNDNDDNSSSSSSNSSSNDTDENDEPERKKLKLLIKGLQELSSNSDSGLYDVLKLFAPAAVTAAVPTTKKAEEKKQKKEKEVAKETDEPPYIYLKFCGKDGPNFRMKGSSAALGRDKSCQFHIRERSLKSKVFSLFYKNKEGIYVVPAKDQSISIDDVPVTTGTCPVRWGQTISFIAKTSFRFVLVASKRMFTNTELSASYDEFYNANKQDILSNTPRKAQFAAAKSITANLEACQSVTSCVTAKPTERTFAQRPPASQSVIPTAMTATTVASVPSVVVAGTTNAVPVPSAAVVSAPITTANDKKKDEHKLTDIKYALDCYFEDVPVTITSQSVPSIDAAEVKTSAIPDSDPEDVTMEEQSSNATTASTAGTTTAATAADAAATEKKVDPKTSIEEGFKEVKDQLVKILEKKIIPPEDITESMDNFTYYLSDTVRKVLVNTTYLYLERPELAEVAAGLKTLAREALLCGPKDTELYQEALCKALAKHFGASVITIGVEDFVDNAVRVCNWKPVIVHNPYKKLLDRYNNTTTNNNNSNDDDYDDDSNEYGRDSELHKKTGYPLNLTQISMLKEDDDTNPYIPYQDFECGVRVVYRRSMGLGMHPDKSRTADGPKDGACGTIVLRFLEHSKRLGVQFDQEFPLGTSLGGFSKPGCGAFVDRRCIEIELSRACAERLIIEALGDILTTPGRTPIVVLIKNPTKLFERSPSLPMRLHQLFDRVKKAATPVVFIGLNTIVELKKLEQAAAAAAASVVSGASSSTYGGSSSSIMCPSQASLSLFQDSNGMPKAIYLSGSKAVYLDIGGHKAKGMKLSETAASERIMNLVQLFPMRIEVGAPADSTELRNWRKLIAGDTAKIRLARNKETFVHVQDSLHVRVLGDIGTIPSMSQVLYSKEEMSQILAHATSFYLQNAPPEALSLPQQQPPPPSSTPVRNIMNKRLVLPFESFTKGLKMLEDISPSTAKSRLEKLEVDDNYERALLSDVITPEESNVRFSDVGALENVKKVLKETVMLPLQRPELFRRGNLAKPTKGILLFGPPGTGKTMLARAVATECGANFLSITPATVTSKYIGESNKYVRALFSLATKIAPTVIFVDEIDSLLSRRGDSVREHETSRKIKNEFMSCWDGLRTSQTERVLVLAATNRPMDLDDAVLRRLSHRVLVDLPDAANREKILRIVLKDEELEDDFDYAELARRTEGYSGSDIRTLCTTAAQRPVHELLEQEKKEREEEEKAAAEATPGEKLGKQRLLKQRSELDKAKSLRKLNAEDFYESIRKICKSVSENAPSLIELRKWNQEFGDGNKTAPTQFSYYN